MGDGGHSNKMRAAMSKAHEANEHIRDVIGVEVGVDQGIHAWEILNEWKEIKTLYLVDNYSTRGLSNYGDARVKVDCFKDRTKWHILPSMEAALLFGPESLDFGYIDASHSYKDVLNDCIRWWPKIKKGGVLCGHDYRLDWHNMKEQSPSWMNAHGVVKAVNEFSEINKLELGTKTDGSASDWWIKK